MQRVKEAVSEIRKVARKEPLTGAEGVVLFLEKVSPALEQVDSSSGAIGTAVNRAVEQLVPILVDAPADAATRARWLARLWEAYQEDAIPYIEQLGEFWGELCAPPAVASRWADELIEGVRLSWSSRFPAGGYFKGTPCCLGALLAAGRHDELLVLIGTAPRTWWFYRRWGVRALVALGRKAEAIRYAEASLETNDNPAPIVRACEEILLSSGLAGEACRRYGLEANQKGTYLATFRAVAKKYPGKAKEEILRDLAAGTPGEEGKWFAAAKDAGLFGEAIRLARQSPCDPRTLARAARDFADAKPGFALEAGMAALYWLVQGYGYDITSADVRAAYFPSMQAAENTGAGDVTRDRIRALVATDPVGDGFVAGALARELDTDDTGRGGLPAGGIAGGDEGNSPVDPVGRAGSVTIRDLVRPHLLAGHVVALVGGMGVTLDPADLFDEYTDGFDLPGYDAAPPADASPPQLGHLPEDFHRYRPAVGIYDSRVGELWYVVWVRGEIN